jgi:competence protein ComEA
MNIKPWHYGLIGFFGGLLVTAVILIITLPERGEPIALHPSSTNSFPTDQSSKLSELTITVHITGEVKNPGIYTLPMGSRLNDAVTAAGGLTDLADPNLLNLASLLEDGSRKYIPSSGNKTTPDSITNEEKDGNLININSANVDELKSLPNIGETKANAIIAYRLEHGLFTNIEELMDVPGIGEAIFASIKDLVTLGP